MGLDMTVYAAQGHGNNIEVASWRSQWELNQAIIETYRNRTGDFESCNNRDIEIIADDLESVRTAILLGSIPNSGSAWLDCYLEYTYDALQALAYLIKTAHARPLLYRADW